jgi:hypothetical protein
MATAPKPWPKEMRAARDGAAEAAVVAARALSPLLSHKDDVVKARAGIALAHLQLALRHLEYAGAVTRPTSDL